MVNYITQRASWTPLESQTVQQFSALNTTLKGVCCHCVCSLADSIWQCVPFRWSFGHSLSPFLRLLSMTNWTKQCGIRTLLLNLINLPLWVFNFCALQPERCAELLSDPALGMHSCWVLVPFKQSYGEDLIFRFALQGRRLWLYNLKNSTSV